MWSPAHLSKKVSPRENSRGSCHQGSWTRIEAPWPSLAVAPGRAPILTAPSFAPSPSVASRQGWDSLSRGSTSVSTPGLMACAKEALALA